MTNEDTHEDMGTVAGFRRLTIEHAGHLLDDALAHLERTDHEFNCPRSRDDYDCTCGLSDVKDRIRERLRTAE